jgi:uroporphyrin-III C-methyltransferase
MPESMGKVCLVGAGPGDPDLLTLKAARRLREAEVVLYDRLVSAEILTLADPNAIFIDTGKEEGHAEAIQQDIHRLLLQYAWEGKRVVRLKGGDPFVFGRGGEEVLFLRQHGIDVEVVPGISSAIAAPALAGIPVTHRGVAASVTVMTARCKGGTEADWSKVARVDTLVILMGVKWRERIARHLLACGRPAKEPAAFIERATTSRERVIETTLGAIAAGKVTVESPAVLVLGAVVKMRSAMLSLCARSMA